MKEWIIGPDDAGRRLDQAMVARARESRKQVKRWLDAGRVRVNGRTVVIAKWAVARGDRVTIETSAVLPATRERRVGKILLKVLYEDHDLIAVDKPPGMIVIPSAESVAPTVVDAVRAYLRRRHPTAQGTYARALHRLDRGTSGVLLLAKSRDGERIIAQFKRHTIHREYVALVHGAVEKAAGTIQLPLAKGRFGHGRKVAAMTEGKPAVTRFTVTERTTKASALQVRVETGRTHQIRVHCAAIGHPLIGDVLYGPSRGAGMLPMGRVALHATRLKFAHPVTGAVVDVRSPLPKDLERLLDRLRSAS